jgi:hypothetical protein
MVLRKIFWPYEGGSIEWLKKTEFRRASWFAVTKYY